MFSVRILEDFCRKHQTALKARHNGKGNLWMSAGKKKESRQIKQYLRPVFFFSF